MYVRSGEGQGRKPLDDVAGFGSRTLEKLAASRRVEKQIGDAKRRARRGATRLYTVHPAAFDNDPGAGHVGRPPRGHLQTGYRGNARQGFTAKAHGG